MSKKGKKSAKKAKNPPLSRSKTPQKQVGMKALVALNYSGKVDRRLKFKKEFISQARTLTQRGFWLIDLSERFKIHRTTLDEWRVKYPAFSDAIYEGAAEFIRGLGPRLVKHMEEGRSYESFSHVIRRSKTWLYELERIDPIFKEYKERGYGSSLYHWEQLAQAQATGSLRRVSKEVVRVDKKGVPMRDPRTGELIVDKIYVPTMGSDRALIFSMQNRFEEYKKDKTGSESELFSELKTIMDHAEADEMKKRDLQKKDK